MLLESIFADLGAGESILVSHRDGDRWPRALVPTVEDAYRYLQDHYEYDVYFGVAPRVGDLETVERVPCVWADYDAKEFGGVLQAAYAAQQRYAAPPSFVVCSGHGYHVYWLLRQAVTPESAQKIMRAVCVQTGADPTHNAKWRLRIPGGQNYKDPAHVVAVVLQESHPERKYDAVDLLRLAAVPPDSAWLLWQTDLVKAPGSKERYPSRSERDLAVLCALVRAKVSEATIEQLCTTMPFGERYREYGGLDKLHKYDLPKAQEMGQRTLGSAFEIHNDAYYYRTDKGVSKVSTFILEPKKLLKSEAGEEDVLLADVRSRGRLWPRETFERSSFNSSAQFLKKLRNAEWQWLGTDPTTRRLLPALMDYIAENDIPSALGTRVLGRHGNMWVSQKGTFNSHADFDVDNAPYVYIPSGRMVPSLSYDFSLDSAAYSDLVRQVYQHLPRMNQAETICPIIGWFFAAPLAPLFREIGVSFPHLNLFGTTGSGKSTTVRDVFLPLFGYTSIQQFTWATTKFALLSALTSTNAIPISFSEYRARTDVRAHQDFIEALRLLYDGSSDVRGRADQTTVEYVLSAPVVIDGEDALDDTTNAVRERSILINLRRESILVGSGPFQALRALTALPLAKFAGRYIRHTLGLDAAALQERFDRGYTWAVNTYPGAPERPLRNLGVLVCGLELYNEFGALHGAVGTSWSQESFAHCLSHTALTTGAGHTRIVVDGFIEDCVRHVDLERIPRFWFDYDRHENVLWMEAYAAFAWWKSQRRSEGRESAGWRAIQVQLEERGALYTVGGSTQIRDTNGQRRRCIGVDLARAFEAGLEVPSVLNVHQSVGPVGGEDFVE